MYPLANDENGVPVEVPAHAVGWLVRRHSGQRGRPGAVYDPEGRPLVVDLRATGRDLRERGCGPSAYRLEAVDENRRPVGVVAFTEIASGEADTPEPRAAHSDPAVEALARTVEAMQRVQAECVRVQAEVIAKLAERVGPAAPSAPPLNLRNAVREAVELDRELRKVRRDDAQNENARVERDDTDEENPLAGMAAQLALGVVDQVMPALRVWIWEKLGLSQEQMAGLAAASGMVPPAAGPVAPAVDPTGSQPPSVTAEHKAPASPDLAARVHEHMDAVWSHLTAEEQTRLSELLASRKVVLDDKVMEQSIRLGPEQTARMIRTLIGSPAAKAATNGGA